MSLDTYSHLAKWANDNQGLVSLAIFAATLLFGWASGIFSALRKKPKFKIRLLDGPTFCCIYETGNEANGYKTHQVGFALYLRISNVGTAASSLEEVQVGYHWDLIPFSEKWLEYSIGWFWLSKLSVALEDFQIRIGNDVKIYPFLFQKTFLSQVAQDTYLEPGKSVLGVVYFEQAESWGGSRPKQENGRVQVRIRIDDTYGNAHYLNTSIPILTIEEARKYNPSFGKTHSNMAGTQLPYDRNGI